VGGIGITNALGFIQEYTRGRLQRGESSGTTSRIMKRAKRFIFAWSAKEMALIQHVKQNFLAHNDEIEGVECLFWCTGPFAAAQNESIDDESHKVESLTSGTVAGVTVGRMDIGNVIRSSLEEGHQTTVLVCGPGNMADEVTREVVRCVRDGFRVDLIEEAFAW
jgi:hypothetical protein